MVIHSMPSRRTGRLLRAVLAGSLCIVCTFGGATTTSSATLGVTTCVSATPAGATGNGASQWKSISADGRYVAFHSMASNLVAGDTNGVRDVFVRDMQTGTTTRVSVATGGAQGNGESSYPTISGNGRYVAFESLASNLVVGDTNDWGDAFVHDLQTHTTTRVSVATGGVQVDKAAGIEGGGGVIWLDPPSITFDGSLVAFYSISASYVATDTNSVEDVFVNDWQNGGGVTERVSLATDGSELDAGSWNFSLSGNGRYLTFGTQATDAVAGDTNDAEDVFRRDLQTDETIRVSLSDADAQLTDWSMGGSMTADGRYVTFSVSGTGVAPGDASAYIDVFVRDCVAGTTEIVSLTSAGGPANSVAYRESISADGRFVAFDSIATNLVAGDTNEVYDVFVRDRQEDTTTRVSVGPGDVQADDASVMACLSADGRYVAFDSYAGNLLTGDENGVQDVFVHDRLAPAPLVVSPVAGGDRVLTAIEASKAGFEDGSSEYVVIATAANWPDALGGSALAGARNAPLLLTPAASLRAEVSAEITRLGATKAIILGGPSAVGTAVEDALKAKLGSGAGIVTRIAGANRYQTARMIAAETIDAIDADPFRNYDGTAFVATGANFPDALGASPLAAAKGWPIYLADPSALDPAMVTEMESNGVTDVLVLGGESAVPVASESALKTAFGAAGVNRLAGANRYATGVAVATYGVTDAALVWNGLAIATGEAFPDALAGGVLQGRLRSVMLLTPKATLDGGVRTVLTAHAPQIGSVHFLGGTGALSTTVRNEVTALLQ